MLFILKIILMFGLFFGLIGFTTSIFPPLEKGEKQAFWSLVVAIICLLGLIFISKL